MSFYAFKVPAASVVDGQEDQQLPGVGLALAVCLGFVGTGTQAGSYNGNTTLYPKVEGLFEIKGYEIPISKTYTLSMAPKASLRRDLETWRGKFHDEKNAWNFDLTQMIGKLCQLLIVHKSSAGKKFANIQAILSPPEGAELFTPKNELICFDIHNPDMDTFNKLPQRLRNKILLSPEWKARQQET